MFKPIIAALIAATALVPPALAQDRGRGDRGGGEWRQRSDNGGQRQQAPQQRNWNRGDRGQQGWTRPAQPQQQPPRGNWQRPDRPQAQPGQPTQRPQWNGNRGNWQRPDRPQAQPGQPAPRPQWNGDRGNWQRPDRPGQPNGWNRGDRGPGGASGVVGPQRPQNQDWRNRDGRDGRDGRDRNWGNRGQDGRDWRNRDNRGRWDNNRGPQFSRRYGDWRDNDRNRGSWNDNRRWSNGWRGDSRYNWRNYRNSNRNIYRLPRYYAPRGYNYGYSRFSIGVTLGSLLFAPDYWINDPFYYRLPPAYGAYRWVRYYNDALLVDMRTGTVVDVEYDIFW